MKNPAVIGANLQLLCLTGVAAIPFSLTAQTTIQRPQKPNILFICTDEQRAATMAVYGNRQFDVPNMNKLADRSVVFMNSYCTQPVCTPSRGSMMTGLYPQKHGATQNNKPLSEDAKCLPELLNDASYATAYFGKWHMGNEVFAQHGFKEFDSCEDNYFSYFSKDRDQKQRSGYHHYLLSKGYKPDSKDGTSFSRGFASTLPYEDTKPNWLAKKAVGFLGRHKDEPFILYVDLLEPHMPFSGPFNEYHQLDKLSLSANVNVRMTENDPVRYRAIAIDQNKDDVLKIYRKYAGLCHSVDICLGEIMTKLDDLGLSDNTIIVYTSDHGEMMGSHSLMYKSVMYEEAVRVPLLIHVPWLQSQQMKVGNLTTNINLVPTLLELLGKNPKNYPDLQGKSLVPILQGKPVKNETAFVIWNDNGKDGAPAHDIGNIKKDNVMKYVYANFRTAISPAGWKLTLSDVDKNQLFNLGKDPLELENLYYTGKYDTVIKAMRTEIIQWQLRTGDNCKLSD